MFENLTIGDVFPYMSVVLLIESFILFAIYLFAGDITWVWLKAWFKKKPISMEWTKSKEWKFQIPTIPNGIPEIWELDKGTRVIEVRREAVGIAPHKVPLMLSTSEFPASINPTEVNGDRYFIPVETRWGVIFNDKLHTVIEPTSMEIQDYSALSRNPSRTADEEATYVRLGIAIEAWRNRKLWVKYPEHGLNVSEFVNFQKVSTDPKIVSAYARRKELDAKISAYSPMNFIMSNPMPILLILVGVGIAYMLIASHSESAACYAQLNSYKDNIIASGIHIPNFVDMAKNMTLPGGGIVK